MRKSKFRKHLLLISAISAYLAVVAYAKHNNLPLYDFLVSREAFGSYLDMLFNFLPFLFPEWWH